MRGFFIGGNTTKDVDTNALKETIRSLDVHANNNSKASFQDGTKQTDDKFSMSNSHRFSNVISNEEIMKNLKHMLEVLSEDRGQHTKRVDQLQKVDFFNQLFIYSV